MGCTKVHTADAQSVQIPFTPSLIGWIDVAMLPPSPFSPIIYRAIEPATPSNLTIILVAKIDQKCATINKSEGLGFIERKSLAVDFSPSPL